MELWNNNDEFRKEYVRCNTRSTLRRLRTLDGRSLGPDEEPPVIPNSLNERIGRSLFAPTKDSSVLIVSTVEQEKQMVPAAAETADDKSVVNVTNQKNRTAKNKNPTKSATGAVSATISGRDEIEETKEEHKQTKEEEELARKAEELRKEEEAAKLKEQRRLEEKAKAKEALERKKRNAEKAQARAELRAQKEAEQKQRVISANFSNFMNTFKAITRWPVSRCPLVTQPYSTNIIILCRKGRRRPGKKKEGNHPLQRVLRVAMKQNLRQAQKPHLKLPWILKSLRSLGQ